MVCSGMEATWRSLINHQRMGGRHLEAEDLSGTEEALLTQCHVLSVRVLAGGLAPRLLISALEMMSRREL